MIKANKCLFYTEEGFSQGEVDNLFSALVLPNFTCGLPVYGAVPGGYSHTLPIRVCAAQRGRDFEAPDLERGIHFRGVF